MTKNTKDMLWAASRSLLFYLAFSLTSTLMGIAMRSHTFSKYLGDFWNNRLYFQVNAVFSLFCLFSIASVFALHDPRLKERFGKLPEPANFLNTSSTILRDRFFWLEFAVFSVMSLAFTGMSPVRDIIFGYFSKIKIALVAKNLSGALIFAAFFLIISFLARLSTIRWWLQQNRKRKKENKGKLPPQIKLALQVAKTAIIWILGGWAMSVVFPVLVTIIGLIWFLCIPIIVIVVCVLFMQHFRAIYMRTRFIKSLESLCKREEIKLSVAGHPYRTIFIPDHGAHITINTPNAKYACRFIGAAKKTTPMFLLDNGNATYIKDRIIFKYFVYENFTFETENDVKKILIACPVPKALYAKNDSSEHLLDVGDRVLDYSVYNSSGFLNALERKCL